tara:strand:- start:4527 stop:4736 length:210 start_codon:yes stop_codon:yes gene_type:complete
MEEKNILSQNQDMYMGSWYKSILMIIAVVLLTCAVIYPFKGFSWNTVIGASLSAITFAVIAFITKKKYK